MAMDTEMWVLFGSAAAFLGFFALARAPRGLPRLLHILHIWGMALFAVLCVVAYRPQGFGRVLADLLSGPQAWLTFAALVGTYCGGRSRKLRRVDTAILNHRAAGTIAALVLAATISACSPMVLERLRSGNEHRAATLSSLWIRPDPSSEFDPYWMSLTASNQITFERTRSDRVETEIRPICYCGIQIEHYQIPRHVAEALMAAEDRRFLIHRGFDPVGIARALLKSGGDQGGSTITQQLVKNTVLNPDRSLLRKANELWIAYRLESRLTKQEIIVRYLNRMNFGYSRGRMVVGIEQAARFYFGKSAANLNIYEGAVLVGLLKAPATFNPIDHPQRADERAREVLLAMHREGFLADAARKRVLRTASQPGRLAPLWPETRPFMYWIMSEASKALPHVQLQPGIRIPITLQLETQWRGQKALGDALLTLTADQAIDGGVVVISDGRIRSMVGGRNHARSQVNHAVQLRQPASTFKPFVYLAAMEAGLVRSFSRFHRALALALSPAVALAVSDNATAQALATAVGIERIRAVAQRLGVVSPLRLDVSLALGGSEVTLVELTAAYQAFANGGYQFEPFGFYGIADSHGNVLVWLKDRSLRKRRVISAPHAKLMRRLLRHVVVAGTGRAAAAIQGAGGKTGTSDWNRDALFIGFARNHVTGVWIGKDDGSAMGRSITGATAARVWTAIERALAR